MLTRLRTNSFEQVQADVKALVESSEWEHGPAELIATFTHHAVVKAVGGNLIRVEHAYNPADFSLQLTNAKVFESKVPVGDIGAELFTTARRCVEAILDEDFDGAAPMLQSISDALDVAGDLDRRVQVEVALRNIGRNAWWHRAVSEEMTTVIEAPAPVTEGQNVILRSVEELLDALKVAAGQVSAAARSFAEQELPAGRELLITQITEDVKQAITALLYVDRTNENELVKVYEAVGDVAGHLLTGAQYLTQLAEME